MNPRAKRIILFAVAAALIFSSSRLQDSLNRDRDRLGMTYTAVLDNAPPMLAFTTVALGGFRGLISNFLWIRTFDLQQDDKFFEASQLANWITDLEPHFAQVWAYQAWNMAWNISVKFKENAPGDYADRWRWVDNGITLLRDQGLRYNPDTTLLYQQLGWIFQSKMGQNMDDGNMYYKREWAKAMTPLFGPQGTNFAALLHPQTPEEKTNVMVLRETYKMDPEFAEKVDEEYGPLDWRLPEAHAIYWGAEGLQKAKEHPDKVKPDDLITLRRLIYQSMLQAFHHGRIIADPYNHTYALSPDLDIVGKVNDAYEKMYADETDHSQQDGILKAHRNFLRDAVYFLYEADRMAEAGKWFKYLGDRFPDKPIIDNQPDSLPKNLTLDEYAVAVVQIDIGETSQERVTAAIAGLMAHSYYELVLGNDDRSLNYSQLAKRVYQRFTTNKAYKLGADRIPLPPYDELNHAVLNGLLDPQQGMSYAARAVLRSALRLPAETNAPPATVSTNAAPPVVNSTNTVPAVTNRQAVALP